MFPILRTQHQNQQKSTLTHYIIHALQQNCFLHYCLSIAEQHSIAMREIQGAEFDTNVIRHKYAATSELLRVLTDDIDHQTILEATLCMTYLPCLAGILSDTIPDLPWHQHFQAAASLVPELAFHHFESTTLTSMKFNMTLTAWIDILGSSITGCAPNFASLYWKKYNSHTQSSLGLRELMGCEDRVMYLISEISCLDELRRGGIDDQQFYQHIHALSAQIARTDMNEPELEHPGVQGSLMPKQLIRDVTTAFRLAARIYLCSLIPNFNSNHPNCVTLVSKLTQVLEVIPSGFVGFDRCLAWVYLMGGSFSKAGSGFRSLFHQRVVLLGNTANIGSFGRVAYLLREIWKQTDETAKLDETNMHSVSWRQIMQVYGWNFLVI